MKQSFLMKGIRCFLLCGILLCTSLLAACSASSDTALSQESQETQSMESAETELVTVDGTYDLSDQMDVLYDCFLWKEDICCLGMKDGRMLLLRFSQDGTLRSEATPLIFSADETPCYAGSKAGCDGISVLTRASSETEDAPPSLITTFSFDGTMVQSTELSGPDRDDSGYYLYENGVFLHWSPRTITVHTNTGTLSVDSPDRSVILDLLIGEASCHALCYADGTTFLCPFDPQTGTFGALEQICDDMTFHAFYTSGNQERILLLSDTHVYEYHVTSRLLTRLFSSDHLHAVVSDELLLLPLAENKIVEVSKRKPLLTLLSATRQTDTRKRIVVAAMSYTSPSLQRYVAHFNSHDPDYYAVIKAYTEETLLLADLTAGSSPDVLELTNTNVPLSTGVLMDLYPSVTRSLQADASSFTGNILSSMMLHQTLLSVTDSFAVNTIIGDMWDVGPKPGWRMEDLETLALQADDGRRLFPFWMTSEEMLLWVCSVSMGEFVDYHTMRCTFDSPDFAALLHLCMLCPQIPADMPDSVLSDHDPSILLAVEMINDPATIAAFLPCYPEGYTYVGFPNGQGQNGSFFERGISSVECAVPLRCSEEEGALRFVCGLLGQDWQNQLSGGLPVIKESYEQSMLAAESLSAGDKAQFDALLADTSLYIRSDSHITSIILEEASAFFSGEKTAEEVSAVIQDRVSIYLQEHA